MKPRLHDTPLTDSAALLYFDVAPGLKNLAVLSTGRGLMEEACTRISEPPLERLKAITARLEETGTVTEQTVADLRQVISTLSMTIPGADARTAARLSYAAEVLGTETLRKAARQLAHAADVLPGTVSQLERAAGQVPRLP